MTEIYNLTPFLFDDRHVRVCVDDEGNPWWIAQDVCGILGLEKVSSALRRLLGNEKSYLPSAPQEGLVRTGMPLAIVNESGLYRLIFRSDKPDAERFQSWVFTDLLPVLRKKGTYAMGETQQSVNEEPSWLAKYTDGQHTAIRKYVKNELDATAQNFTSRIEDVQRDNNKKLESIGDVQTKTIGRLEAVEKTVASIATVAAGPYPPEPYEGPISIVWSALQVRKNIQGISGNLPVDFVRALQAYMYENYEPVKSVPLECRKPHIPIWMQDHAYKQKDFEEALNLCEHYGNQALRNLKPIDRLKAEVEFAKTKGKIREVPRPKKYDPQSNH